MPRENYVEREVLGSVYIDELHAIYPTAYRTLCGLECHGEVLLSLTPSCSRCREQACVMWRVDRSVPAGWMDSEGDFFEATSE